MQFKSQHGPHRSVGTFLKDRCLRQQMAQAISLLVRKRQKPNLGSIIRILSGLPFKEMSLIGKDTP